MSNRKPDTLLGRFLALPVDSTPKTIFVAVTLCLFCSMIVAFAAVNLRPIQSYNKALDKKINILQVAGLYKDDIDVESVFKAFEAKIVDMKTGKFTNAVDVKNFDDRKASKDPKMSSLLVDDPASIGRKPNFTTVYLLKKEDGSLDKIILPVYGYGLWSTLYGFIALEKNGNDIFGLQFYEHAETPGLGAEVDNPRWKAQWKGKKLRDDQGNLMIQVAKVAKEKQYHIDALAGATLTSNGVDNLVKFWMGESGFALFISNLKAGTV
ncbi:MAG: Na(+)-translocating NADH-quinone reductase subunit C [Rhodospirillaceae bacterium]|nr:Na(+)-translocating NADH-quinone reductase subunit C [Rhodospirillaceae bacterium]MBT7731793.1 Na(+)-translocating NADH-quinone reductase subunit C [Rhodospirillaceae bacterium]MDC0999457.1 Na(+)-translocating NADH-quinone reductase subunit C [Alphaproteobacteria bacterium]MDC1442884.1 Na(+)-translocating NADH-quinone reductase subunit C [Rhodospirillaceae bacterium]